MSTVPVEHVREAAELVGYGLRRARPADNTSAPHRVCASGGDHGAEVAVAAYALPGTVEMRASGTLILAPIVCEART